MARASPCCDVLPALDVETISLLSGAARWRSGGGHSCAYLEAVDCMQYLASSAEETGKFLVLAVAQDGWKNQTKFGAEGPGSLANYHSLLPASLMIQS